MKKFYVGVKGVVRDKNRGIILLHRDYKSGDYWDVPGGRIDGDEDLTQALTRELDEELPGITSIKVGELLGAHRLQKDIEGDTSLVLLYFLVDATLPDPVILSEEHESYTWLKNQQDIPDNLNPEIKKILKSLLN